MGEHDIPNILPTKLTLLAKYPTLFEHPLFFSVERLLLISDYAGRHIHHLKQLLEDNNTQVAYSLEDYQQLVQRIPLEIPHHVMMKSLREFRHYHLLRLMMREFTGISTTEQTMAEWSDCAEALILRAIAYAKSQLVLEHGFPRTNAGEPAIISVIAMGKLGGRELNFSSDVDLIFLFQGVGVTDGQKSVSNHQFFDKLVKLFVLLLQSITVDGFVFRVDLRLRPNGESGPLISTEEAMEAYYQEQGRDWERYAMVKARLLSPSDSSLNWFTCTIIPFVYRRYIDFSVIESLRSLKTMIEREIKINPRLDDIKRGQGGIREVEFVIQCFQLVRGGRLLNLQQRNALAALRALKDAGLLAHTDVIGQAYLFLRKLENALQMQNDRQTHALPDEKHKQGQLVVAMDAMNWESLIAKLNQHRRIINKLFHAVLKTGPALLDEKRLLDHQLNTLWAGHMEPAMAANLLASLKFKESERCYQMINAFRHAPRCRRLGQAGRLRLDKLMVLVLGELACRQETDTLLLNVLSLLENIVGRSAYLALLTENPAALQEVLHRFSQSPFISDLIVQQPFLLEVLLLQENTWQPETKVRLQLALQDLMAHSKGPEDEGDLLRQFKLTCWLKAARLELDGRYDAVRMGRFLATLAEVIIEEVVQRACLQLMPKHPSIMRIKAHFAVIAYGKLGSCEMNYDSDMDLVFLHSVAPEDEPLVTRLSQKILHMLTTRSQMGILYSVDTRLRPSGAAGLLVSHVDAFLDYQMTRAWTWEHQALLKARVVFGNSRFKNQLSRLKKNVLELPREASVLARDVLEMRTKIGKHGPNHSLKHADGGLLDLEFLVQFLILAKGDARCVYYTNTRAYLRHLCSKGHLTASQFAQLNCAFGRYHEMLHQAVLMQSVVLPMPSLQADVMLISQQLMKND